MCIRDSFTITPSGDCSKATCTPTKAGKHTLTGRATPGRHTHLRAPAPPEQPACDHLDLHEIARRQRQMCIRDSFTITPSGDCSKATCTPTKAGKHTLTGRATPVSYTHLRAHETPEHLVCRL